jgi:hypothetical protein
VSVEVYLGGLGVGVAHQSLDVVEGGALVLEELAAQAADLVEGGLLARIQPGEFSDPNV